MAAKKVMVGSVRVPAVGLIHIIHKVHEYQIKKIFMDMMSPKLILYLPSHLSILMVCFSTCGEQFSL